MTTATDATELDRMYRQLSGNQMKLLVSMDRLDKAGRKTSPQAIAEHSGLSLATVYRLIPQLAADDYLDIRISQRGRACVDYAVSAMTSLMLDSHDIIDSHGSRYKRPQDQASQTENPSQIAHRVNPQNENHSQYATPNHAQLSSNHVNRVTDIKQGYPSPDRLIALEYARKSHEQVGDRNSLGMHRSCWQHALTIDAHFANDKCFSTLKAIAADLHARAIDTGYAQGAAWTNRVTQYFRSIGQPLPKRQTTGNDQRHHEKSNRR